MYPVVNVIGVFGCYGVDFLLIYGTFMLQSISLGIALFRYFSLTNVNFLLRRGLSPMVSLFVHKDNFDTGIQRLANIIITGQLIMPLLTYAGIRLGSAEVTPKNGPELLRCLGQNERLFDQDITLSMCDGSASGSGSQWIACNIFFQISQLMCSNIPEMFLLWKSIQMIKSKTSDVKRILSLAAYKRRER